MVISFRRRRLILLKAVQGVLRLFYGQLGTVHAGSQGMNTSVQKDENGHIAKVLADVADLLQQQNASSFRIGAYRKAAEYIANAAPNLREVYETTGLAGLDALPTIGTSIAKAVSEILETGSLAMLARLRGSLDPERLFQSVPTIGPHIARQLHDELHLETLEALEAAAVNGRLGKLKGIGPRRVRSIQHSLESILARRRPTRPDGQVPPIEAILEVDETYRSRAKRGTLATITPKRFNPNGENRIPVLHTEIGPWRFTAMFSNTPNAHRFGRTKDWVVVYFEGDGATEGQCTVVTEHNGPLAGMRVVRGFEAETARLRSASGHETK